MYNTFNPSYANSSRYTRTDFQFLQSFTSSEEKLNRSLSLNIDLFKQSYKTVGGVIEKDCPNVSEATDQDPVKNRFKFVFNGQIKRGFEAYEYTGNRIELISLDIRLRTDLLSDYSPGKTYQYYRGLRFTLCYMPLFSGEDKKIPPFTKLFSGYSAGLRTLEGDLYGKEVSDLAFSLINSDFTNSVYCLYDRYFPIGCLLPPNNSPYIPQTIYRTNGNVFFSQEFDLKRLPTVFTTEELYQEEEDLYKNISEGLLILYVSIDYENNENKTDTTKVIVDWRLTYKTE